MLVEKKWVKKWQINFLIWIFVEFFFFLEISSDVQNGGKTVGRSVDWVRGNFSGFFLDVEICEAKKWDIERALPGSCGNFQEKSRKLKKIFKLLEKNEILKNLFFNFHKLPQIFDEFCVLRAIFWDCQTPENKDRSHVKQRECIAQGKILG